MKKVSFFLTTILCTVLFAKAQNTFPSTGSTGIGTATPNASAILEIKSTTQGMLAPRMTKAQRNVIATPATGLLIYQTNNTPGFYYYSGTAWTAVSSAGANTSLSNLTTPTAINAALLPDSSNFRNLGNATHTWKSFYFDGTIYSQGHKFISNDGANLTCVFMGDMAGNVNATYGNAGFGAQALLNNTKGLGNSGLGSQSLYSNTTGSENTALGYLTLFSNTTGGRNAVSGAYAMEFNTIGSNNSAFGVNALLNNNTGNNNTANGYQALNLNIEGSNNVGSGYNALFNNTTGNENTAIGIEAGYENIVGNYNTFLGAYAGSAINQENSVCIGYSSLCGYSNFVSIGNSSVSVIGGQVGWSSFSDGRVKDNIKKDVPGLSFINKLNPVTYNLNIHRQNEMMKKGKKDSANWKGKYDIEKKKMTGFVAQEVEKAAEDLGYDFSGVVKPPSSDGLYALTYSEFVVPLVKAVQELSTQNDSLKKQASAQEKINVSLQKQIDDLKKILLSVNQNNTAAVANLQKQNIIVTGATVEQNTPNPFSSSTIIHYTLPQKFSSSQIIITDKSGKVLKQLNITGAGRGSLNVDAAMLSSGAYNYSFYVDGKLIGSKQMLLAK